MSSVLSLLSAFLWAFDFLLTSVAKGESQSADFWCSGAQPWPGFSTMRRKERTKENKRKRGKEWDREKTEERGCFLQDSDCKYLLILYQTNKTLNIHAETQMLERWLWMIKSKVKTELPTVETVSTITQQMHLWLRSLPVTDFFEAPVCQYIILHPAESQWSFQPAKTEHAAKSTC